MIHATNSRAHRRRSVLVLALAAAGTGCIGGNTEPGYRTATGGDPERGAEAVRVFGCGACHRVPGIRQARGVVGPSLDEFARRTFIAGEFPNNSDNLMLWVMNPPSLSPRTAMPALGVSEAQARDLAAFLYTLD